MIVRKGRTNPFYLLLFIIFTELQLNFVSDICASFTRYSWIKMCKVDCLWDIIYLGPKVGTSIGHFWGRDKY